MDDEWGRQCDQGTKVQCVRRFGLTEDATESGGNEARRRARHITAVEMSPDEANDVSRSARKKALGEPVAHFFPSI